MKEKEVSNYKIQPTGKNKILEIKRWSIGGKSFETHTAWADGFAILVDEPTLPNDYDPDIGLNLSYFSCEDLNFDDGKTEFKYIDNFTESEKKDLQMAYSEFGIAGLEDMDCDFEGDDCWMKGSLSIEKYQD